MYPLFKDKKILKFAILSHKGSNKKLDGLRHKQAFPRKSHHILEI